MIVRLLPSGSDLIQQLDGRLRSADEAVLLMARVSSSGFRQLRPALLDIKRRRKAVTIILGLNMIGTSSPDAIRALFRLHDARDFRLLCYGGRSFFHPKLFAFRRGAKWSFVIGSSNLTEEGLSHNIELNVLLSELPWSNRFVRAFYIHFKSLIADSGEFSSRQIESLSEQAAMLNRKLVQVNKAARTISLTIRQGQSREVSKWDQLVGQMNDFKSSEAYKERLERIPKAIRACKKTIGKAGSPRIDAERWNGREVGFFSNLDNRNYKRTHVTSKKKAQRLRKALSLLLDQRIPIDQRLRAIVPPQGRLHIRGMGISLVSEILSKYYPNEYAIVGNPIIEALRNYGMRYIPSDAVERYLAVLRVYERLRSASRFPKRFGYLLLDRFMWEKGHKILYGW